MLSVVFFEIGIVCAGKGKIYIKRMKKRWNRRHGEWLKTENGYGRKNGFRVVFKQEIQGETMVLFEIENADEFMNSLFVKEWLDLMELVEGEITTFCNIKIDGRRYLEWYDSQEKENRESAGEFITWKEYKQQAFQLIRGKKVPLLFRLVLRLPESRLEKLMEAAGGELLPEDIQGMYLNIKYEKKLLRIVTGASLRKFSTDRSLEREWDDQVGAALKKHGFYEVQS